MFDCQQALSAGILLGTDCLVSTESSRPLAQKSGAGGSEPKLLPAAVRNRDAAPLLLLPFPVLFAINGSVSFVQSTEDRLYRGNCRHLDAFGGFLRRDDRRASG